MILPMCNTFMTSPCNDLWNSLISNWIKYRFLYLLQVSPKLMMKPHVQLSLLYSLVFILPLSSILLLSECCTHFLGFLVPLEEFIYFKFPPFFFLANPPSITHLFHTHCKAGSSWEPHKYALHICTTGHSDSIRYLRVGNISGRVELCALPPML